MGEHIYELVHNSTHLFMVYLTNKERISLINTLIRNYLSTHKDYKQSKLNYLITR